MPEITYLLNEIGEIKGKVGEQTGALAGVKSSIDGLRGSFDALAHELRAGQAAQDTRINDISTQQARHSGVIGVWATLIAVASSFAAHWGFGH